MMVVVAKFRIGAGTRDAAFILLLGQMGIARQESLALSSLILAVFLVNCGGALSYLGDF